MRQAILSDRMLFDGEKPAEFCALLQELNIALALVGIVEAALVERIAISVWPQRGVSRAESAALALATQLIRNLKVSARSHGHGFGRREPVDGRRNLIELDRGQRALRLYVIPQYASVKRSYMRSFPK